MYGFECERHRQPPRRERFAEELLRTRDAVQHGIAVCVQAYGGGGGIVGFLEVDAQRFTQPGRSRAGCGDGPERLGDELASVTARAVP